MNDGTYGTLAPGDRIVVRTPDRRAYFGRLLEVRPTPASRQSTGGRLQAVVRLDTGWVTAYPLHMVHPAGDDAGDPSADVT